MSRTNLAGSCAVLSALALISPLFPKSSAAEETDDVAVRAMTVLEQNCGSSGCHGGSNPYSFDVRNPSTLIESKVIQPGDAARSEMIRRLEAGVMPLGGYRGQAGVKLPDQDIAALKSWIDAGAHAPQSTAITRPFITETHVLDAILRDLEGAPKADRSHLRYFSIANLWNSAAPENALGLYRGALSKLVNHLSWKREIRQPAQIGAGEAVLRIDLRDYGWTGRTWEMLVAAYPYGIIPADLHNQADRIRALSGAAIPYMRVDWFVTNASVSPLYDEILRLPDNVDELESMLKVNIASNMRIGRSQRFGLRNSGVSRNNRVMERNPTPHGAYWKSFDFSGSRMEQNIFRDPLHLTPDGGEIIFNLPNGLQGYMIVNAQGKAIDDAPVSIVRDRSNPDDPVVHNGRSCIGCHIKGTNGFQDEVSARLQQRVDAVFDVDRAAALYPGQPALDRVLEEDNLRFIQALARTGSGVPAGSEGEPIAQLTRRHERALSVSDAAAELFMRDSRELQRLIAASPELQKQGFDQLLGPKGGIKRDTWEQGFAQLGEELGLGESFAPTRLVRIPAGETVALKLDTPLNTRTVRRGDDVLFRTARDVRTNDRVLIPRESIIHGLVTQVQRAEGNAAKATLQFQLDEIQLADGSKRRLPASVVELKEVAHSMNDVLGRNGGVDDQPNWATLITVVSEAIAKKQSTWPDKNNREQKKPNEDQFDIPRGSMFEARF